MGTQVEDLNQKHRLELRASRDSLSQQLQHLESELSSQSALALHQKAALDSCQTDRVQLQESAHRLDTDNQVLKSRLVDLQATADQRQRQHDLWAWRLASLQHWRRHGAAKLHSIMQAWAAVACATAHELQEDQVQQFGSGVTTAAACGHNRTHLHRSNGAERLSEQQPHAMDGWRYHNRRLLGCCFRGDACHTPTVCEVKRVSDYAVNCPPGSTFV